MFWNGKTKRKIENLCRIFPFFFSIFLFLSSLHLFHCTQCSIFVISRRMGVVIGNRDTNRLKKMHLTSEKCRTIIFRISIEIITTNLVCINSSEPTNRSSIIELHLMQTYNISANNHRIYSGSIETVNEMQIDKSQLFDLFIQPFRNGAGTKKNRENIKSIKSLLMPEQFMQI